LLTDVKENLDLWGFKSQCSTCAVKELCFAVKRTAFLERKTASTVWRHCMLSKKLVLLSKGQHSSKERQHRLCGGTVCCQRSLFCCQKDSIPRKKDSINCVEALYAVKEACFAVKRTAFLERKTASTMWRHCMLSKKLVLRSKGQHSSKERQHQPNSIIPPQIPTCRLPT